MIVNNIFLIIFIYFFIYQIIKNPNNKKKTPILLNFTSEVFSIVLSIFFILVGNIAKKKPSIKKSNPIAVNSSLMQIS